MLIGKVLRRGRKDGDVWVGNKTVAVISYCYCPAKVR